MTNLDSSLTRWSETLDKLKRHRDGTLQEYKNAKSLLRGAKRSLATAEEAHAVVTAAVEQAQSYVHTHLAGLVTRALASVLSNPYTFEARFETKRNNTQVRFVFCRDGLEVDEPEDCIGGGVMDLAAFTLRVGALCLRNKGRRLLVLDEPFRNLSEEYRGPAQNFITEIVEELDFQIVIVTHMDQLQIGKQISLS